MYKAETMGRLRAAVANGTPVIVAGVGSGLSARGAASGGADVLAHGGPFNDASSVALALERTLAEGYVTGSTAERMPIVWRSQDAEFRVGPIFIAAAEWC